MFQDLTATGRFGALPLDCCTRGLDIWWMRFLSCSKWRGVLRQCQQSAPARAHLLGRGVTDNQSMSRPDRSPQLQGRFQAHHLGTQTSSITSASSSHPVISPAPRREDSGVQARQLSRKAAHGAAPVPGGLRAAGASGLIGSIQSCETERRCLPVHRWGVETSGFGPPICSGVFAPEGACLQSPQGIVSEKAVWPRTARLLPERPFETGYRRYAEVIFQEASTLKPRKSDEVVHKPRCFPAWPRN